MSNNSNQPPNAPRGKVGDGDPPTELIKPPSGTGSRNDNNNGTPNSSNGKHSDSHTKSTLGFNGSTSLTRRPSTQTPEKSNGGSSVSARTVNQEPKRLSYQAHAFANTPGAGAHSSHRTRVNIKRQNTKDSDCGSHSKKRHEPLTEKKDNSSVALKGKRGMEQDQTNRKKIRASPVPSTLFSTTSRPIGIDTNENIFSPTFKQNRANNNKNENNAFATQSTQGSEGNETRTTTGNDDGSNSFIVTEADAALLGNKTDAELVSDYDVCVSQLEEHRKQQDILARSIERTKRDCKTLDKEMKSLQEQKSKKVKDLDDFEKSSGQVNAGIESSKAQMKKLKLEMEKRLARLDKARGIHRPRYRKQRGPGTTDAVLESKKDRYRINITDLAYSRKPEDHKRLQEIVKTDLERVFLSFYININRR